MFLIDDILVMPLKGVIWLGEKINEMVEAELFNEGCIRERLMALQLRFELDEISEEEYNKQEKELLALLDTIMKAKEEEA